jgi:hypothetical protein
LRAAAGALAIAALAAPSVAHGAWRELPQAPLSPREAAVGVWTGREALVLGGSDSAPCPPNAGCRAATVPPLREGAAYDPRTRSWRRIADAPVAFDFANAVRVRRRVYVVTPGNDTRPGSPPAALAYDIRRDRWRRLPTPPAPQRNYSLVAAGRRVVVHGFLLGPSDSPGYVLARGGRAWRPLPPAPLPNNGQALVWSGRELIAIRSAYVGRDLSRPPLARAAAYSFRTGRWRRLPDSETVLFGHGWVRVGRRLVSPALGTGDGEYRWGRPHGGILDPERGTWSDLPNPPAVGPSVFGTGVLTRARGHYSSLGGWVLDMTRERWLEIPRLDRQRSGIFGRTIADAGRGLLAFGGARFGRRAPDGGLLDDAWLWTPPPPAAR